MHRIEVLVRAVDYDRDFIISADELHALLDRVQHQDKDQTGGPD